MFFIVEIKMTRLVAVQQCASGDHFSVKPRVLGQQAMESTAVSIRPVHHRRDGNAERVVKML